MTDTTLRGTDWAQDVCDGITRDVRSLPKRAAMARRFADIGRYTDEARQLLRDYAARQVQP
jgi:hypothetical protein